MPTLATFKVMEDGSHQREKNVEAQPQTADAQKQKRPIVSPPSTTDQQSAKAKPKTKPITSFFTKKPGGSSSSSKAMRPQTCSTHSKDQIMEICVGPLVNDDATLSDGNTDGEADLDVAFDDNDVIPTTGLKNPGLARRSPKTPIAAKMDGKKMLFTTPTPCKTNESATERKECEKSESKSPDSVEGTKIEFEDTSKVDHVEGSSNENKVENNESNSRETLNISHEGVEDDDATEEMNSPTQAAEEAHEETEKIETIEPTLAPSAEAPVEDDASQKSTPQKRGLTAKPTGQDDDEVAVDSTLECTTENVSALSTPASKTDCEKTSKDKNDVPRAKDDVASTPEPRVSTAKLSSKKKKPMEAFVMRKDADSDVVVVERSQQQSSTSPQGAKANPPRKKTLNASENKSDTECDKQTKKEAESMESTLTEEVKSLLAKHEKMRVRYTERSKAVIERAHDKIEDEEFDSSDFDKANAPTATSVEAEFPDWAVPSLAVVIQGSPLPLSELANRAVELLQKHFSESKFTAEIVTAKIKLLASRDCYVEGGQANKTANDGTKQDLFEDSNAAKMWRWELISLDLLPEKCVSKAKRARAARKKLRTEQRAISKLLSLLDEADRIFLGPTGAQQKRSDIQAKISSSEEKVLKYEREEERVRLAEESKKKKEQAKKQKMEERLKEKEEKMKAKQRAEEEKKKEKAEKERKKKEAAEARSAQKRKKDQQRTEEKKKIRLEKEQKEAKKQVAMKKQQSMMMSFFRKPKPASTDSEPVTASEKTTANSFDVEGFRALINASGFHKDCSLLFEKLTENAIASRKRRTRKVSVTVFVTVLPESPMAEQPYDEQKDIQVPNKFKFLSFHEDYRPPYHGTWSKPRSSVVTGRTPFGTDTDCFDYEVDSEAEWEEGDDDPGEDCEDESADDEEENLVDEEGDTRVYNYQDGWLTHDYDLGQEDDEVDEETLALRKKHLQESGTDNCADKKQNELSTVCVIAPAHGGRPLASEDIANEPEQNKFVEGVSPTEALDFLAKHESIICTPNIELCLDAFPPDLVDEKKQSEEDSPKGASGPNKEMSREDLITFVTFVHNCTLPSKDKVVEQLRAQHKDITSSRAQATRKLDLVAVKKRHPSGGSVWEVKKEVLKELGLEKLLDVPMEVAEPLQKQQENPKKITPKKAAKPPTSSKHSDGDCDAKSTTGKKRKRVVPAVSKKTANLFAAFLKKKKVADSSSAEDAK